jgi:hypothetical protein
MFLPVKERRNSFALNFLMSIQVQLLLHRDTTMWLDSIYIYSFCETESEEVEKKQRKKKATVDVTTLWQNNASYYVY